MEQRKFTREVTLEAVKLIQARGVTVTQAARDLGCMARCCADGCRSVRPIRSRPLYSTGHSTPRRRTANGSPTSPISGWPKTRSMSPL